MKIVAIVLSIFLPVWANSYTIKATGRIRVRIVAPEIAQNETPTVVYTEIGPTAQVVF